MLMVNLIKCTRPCWLYWLNTSRCAVNEINSTFLTIIIPKVFSLLPFYLPLQAQYNYPRCKQFRAWIHLTMLITYVIVHSKLCRYIIQFIMKLYRLGALLDLNINYCLRIFLLYSDLVIFRAVIIEWIIDSVIFTVIK